MQDPLDQEVLGLATSVCGCHALSNPESLKSIFDMALLLSALNPVEIQARGPTLTYSSSVRLFSCSVNLPSCFCNSSTCFAKLPLCCCDSRDTACRACIA